MLTIILSGYLLMNCQRPILSTVLVPVHTVDGAVVVDTFASSCQHCIGVPERNYIGVQQNCLY